VSFPPTLFILYLRSDIASAGKWDVIGDYFQQATTMGDMTIYTRGNRESRKTRLPPLYYEVTYDYSTFAQ
jgi:hypothetical protein